MKFTVTIVFFQMNKLFFFGESSSVDCQHAEAIRDENEKSSNRKIIKLNKLKRNSGQAYTSLNNGKVIQERQPKELGTCKLKCRERVPTVIIKKLFGDYWSLGTYSLRQAFLCKLMRIEEKNRATNLKDPKKNRTKTVTYSISVDFKSQKVCKKCFLSIFGETEAFINTIVKKASDNTLFKDGRGKGVKANKIPIEKVDCVKAHIESFPSYVSHYCRSHTNKMYLAPGLTIAKMFNLYITTTEQPVSLTLYRKIFKSLGLKIKQPQLDTCSKCDQFVMDLKTQHTEEERNIIIGRRDQHQQQAEMAYESKRLDKLDQDKTVLCFDLQKCLPTPSLRCQEAFYKRSLWVFNLTIRDCSNGKTTCFMWDETIAKRGANEVASCVWRYFEMNQDLKQHVVMYSDTCPGQNRNTVMTAMFLLLVQKFNNISIIEHKFLEPGHTHMECDSDHANIERKKKLSGTDFYHPHDWYQLVSSCKTGKNPFAVEKMTRENFYDFNSLFIKVFKKCKLNEDKNQVKWSKMRIVRYSKETFAQVQYKNSYDSSNFEVADMKKVRTRKNEVNLANILLNLPNIHLQAIPVSNKKKKDLLSLLRYIPDVFHEFYKNLHCDGSTEDFFYETDED